MRAVIRLTRFGRRWPAAGAAGRLRRAPGLPARKITAISVHSAACGRHSRLALPHVRLVLGLVVDPGFASKWLVATF
jgi:hypothetical protein